MLSQQNRFAIGFYFAYRMVICTHYVTSHNITYSLFIIRERISAFKSLKYDSNMLKKPCNIILLFLKLVNMLKICFIFVCYLKLVKEININKKQLIINAHNFIDYEVKCTVTSKKSI